MYKCLKPGKHIYTLTCMYNFMFAIRENVIINITYPIFKETDLSLKKRVILSNLQSCQISVIAEAHTL